MNDLAWHGQPWRLITSALLHLDLFHLAFNLYWLWVFGTLMEEVFGHWKTAALMLFLAAGSSAAEYAVMIGGVGLSGVGYGLFGALWVLGRTDKRFYGAVDGQTTALFVAWFFLCCFLTYTGLWPVGNVAHLAGAVLGALAGLVLGSQGVRRRIAATLLLQLVILVVIGASIGRQYINLSSKAGDELAFRAYQEQNQGHDESAVRLYREALAFDDRQGSWWYNLGIAYQKLGNTELAIEAYERASTLEPNEAKYRAALNALRPSIEE
jgi:GlpG protein